MASTRNTLPPYKSITAGDLSQASLTSSVTSIRFLDVVTMQFNCTGTPTGTWAIQVSLDNANWVTLTITPPLALVGAPAVLGAKLDIKGWSFIRAVYTRTGGTGNVTMFVAGAAS